jgi:hypothetical protein
MRRLRASDGAAWTYLVVAGIGLVFGAIDQFLGSRPAFGAWGIAVSQMSAGWLALPFVIGTIPRRRGTAAGAAFIATVSALIGYFAMTCSAVENVPLERFSSCFSTVATTGYNPLWILGGVVFAPILGVCGHAWRIRGAWAGPVLVVAAFCLEPLARARVGMLTPASRVWFGEVAVGLALASVLVMTRRRHALRTPP